MMGWMVIGLLGEDVKKRVTHGGNECEHQDHPDTGFDCAEGEGGAVFVFHMLKVL